MKTRRTVMVSMVYTLTAALLLGIGTGYGKDRRRAEAEAEAKRLETLKSLEMHQAQLEKIRTQRWQEKRNAVVSQKAFNDMWNELKREVDRLSALKSRKEENFLRWSNQKSEKQEEVEGLKQRFKGIKLQVTEKIESLEEKIVSGFPHNSQKQLDRLATLKLTVQSGTTAGLMEGLDGLFGVWGERFLSGETQDLTRGKLTVSGAARAAAAGHDEIAKKADKAGTQVEAGYYLRLGTFYKCFYSTESEDAAILVKTGRIDRKAWKWVETLHEKTRTQLREQVAQVITPDPEKSTEASLGLAYVPIDVQLTNATGEGYTTSHKTTFWSHMKKEFKEGKWVMYPILFVALLGLFLVVERSVYFFRKDQRAARLMKRVNKYVQEGKLNEARTLVKGSHRAVSKVIDVILGNADKSREKAEERAYEMILKETPKLETRISTINILAAASPLVGLLGTVSGMVTLFGVITVHGTSNPKLMAGGISEALIATKWGLGVAVPLLLLYNLMDLWSSKIVSNMEKYSTALINDLFGEAPDPDATEQHKNPGTALTQDQGDIQVEDTAVQSP